MVVFHPRARLDSYVEDALPPAARDRVSAHLVDCQECRQDVDQRERILRAASSLGPVPGGSSPSAPSARTSLSAAGTSPAVLEAREGIAGWKVVLGMGAVGLFATGVLATAWIAGDPTAGDDPGDRGAYLLPVAGSPSASADADADSSAATGPDGAEATAGSAGTPGSSAGTGALFPAGADLPLTGGAGAAGTDPADSGTRDRAGVAVVGSVALTPAMVTELRQLGWNVPSLFGLGLRNQATDWHRGQSAAEVVVTLRNDDGSLVLHECRPLQDGAGTPSCPVAWAGVGTDVPAAGTGASAGAGGEVKELPVGVDMSVQEHPDGSWTAALQTAEASYAVDSDLPVESAGRVMSMVVISERSRVQGGTAPERPADRLARGFDRLLPWSQATEAAVR